MKTDVEEIEKINLSEDDNSEIPPTDIVAYNELRSCADLFRLYNDGVLDIHPDFQRDIVWNLEKQSRFIDSLIKQLPIPSLCLTLDYKTEKRVVIDGLQRIQSIINFLSENWELANLDDIDNRIAGKTVSEIKEKNSLLIERVKNAVLPITILRCDLSKESHANYLFTIFHRLNSGGTALNNQEIRNAIYAGNFNNFLKKANQYPKWRVIIGMNDDISYRFLKEELILRFFAFFDNQSLYTGKLAKFLNSYMHENRKISESNLADKSYYFYKTVDLIYEKITAEGVMEKTTNAIVESILIGVAKNLDKLNEQSDENIKSLYHKILNSEPFSQENLAYGLSGKEKVNNRLSTAIKYFLSKLMAIRIGNIIHNIDDLEILYNNTQELKRQFFYAKLAVLEACGWIEETMDEIIQDYYTRKLSNVVNQDEISRIVNRTSGFDYNDNFRKMIIHLVGLVRTERIENNLNSTGTLPILKAKLGNLKVFRNQFAHTHTKRGSIPNYPHFTTIKSEINSIFTYLKSYQKELRKIR